MLNRQLGGEGWGSWDSAPSKPKWMRWQTYDLKYERWERAVEKANAELIARAMKRLKRREDIGRAVNMAVAAGRVPAR